MTYAQKYLKKQDVTAQERANLGTLCWMERYPLTNDAAKACTLTPQRTCSQNCPIWDMEAPEKAETAE